MAASDKSSPFNEVALNELTSVTGELNIDELKNLKSFIANLGESKASEEFRNSNELTVEKSGTTANLEALQELAGCTSNIPTTEGVKASNELVLKLLRPFYNVSDIGPPVPNTDAEWVNCLLLLIFHSCAMSFNFYKKYLSGEGMQKQVQSEPCTTYWVGSFFEGIACYVPNNPSDTDRMNVLKRFFATVSTEGTESHSVFYARRETVQLEPGSYPCYVRLVASEATENLILIAKATNYGPVIRSSHDERLMNHTFESDDSLAVECDKWPLESMEWGRRSRPANWPNDQLIQECRNTQCYIVSKSHASNPDDPYEWRFSFVRQEGILMRALPTEVKMTYILTKFLMKQVIKADDEFSTYHLKTLLLWHCELKSFKEFSSCALNKNVVDFIDFAVGRITDGDLRNYFIPKNNMASHLSSKLLVDTAKKMEIISSGMLFFLTDIQESKDYPFSICSLASAIVNKTQSYEEIYLRYQSNIIYILIDVMFHSSHYNTMLIEMYTKHLVNTASTCEVLPVLIDTSQEGMKLAKVIFEGKFTSLLLLVAALYEDVRAKVPELPKVTLEKCNLVSVEALQFQYSCAEVFHYLGKQKSACATRDHCYFIYDHVHTQAWQQSVLMFSIKEMINDTKRDGQHEEYMFLISRIREIASLLQCSVDDIEVSIATIVRLHSASKECMKIFETLCELIPGVSMNGALKHLVYAIVLNGEKEAFPSERDKIINTMTKCIRDDVSLKVFLLVSAIIVLQKCVNGQLDSIESFVKLMSKMPEGLHDVREMCTDVQELLSTRPVSIDSAFQLTAYHVQIGAKVTNVTFTTSVLDDLLKPEYNLGILVLVGLSPATSLDTALELLKLWVERATIAPIIQRQGMYASVYARLGHLYHIKAAVDTDPKMIALHVNLSDTMFQSAKREPSGEMSTASLKVLMALYERQFKPSRVNSNLEDTCDSSEDMSLSVFNKDSLAIFTKELKDIRAEILKQGTFTASSVVLFHFIALKLHISKHCNNKVPPESVYGKHITYIDKVIGFLEQQGCDDTERGDHTVLFNTHLLAGIYCYDVKLMKDAGRHFSKAKEYNSNSKSIEKWLLVAAKDTIKTCE